MADWFIAASAQSKSSHRMTASSMRIDITKKVTSIAYGICRPDAKGPEMTDVGLGTAHRSARVSDIEILPLDSVLGTEIRCGDLRKLDDASFAQIRAWLDHLVLVFRKRNDRR
jgi:hypothetical protein